MPSIAHNDPEQTSKMEVLIVGCGFAGLACAIECTRKGLKATVLEKHGPSDILGDVISFAPNTGRLFERWGIGPQLVEVCSQHPILTMHNFNGQILAEQHLPQKVYGSNSYNGRRGEIHDVLLKYAQKLGVDIRYGHNVTEYWECEKEGRVGVIVDGARISADVVIGADGVRSRARELVLGYTDKPKSSGYAIYRAWFKATEQGVDTDPLTKHFVRNGGEFHGWLGKDVHMLAMTFKDGEECCWLLTHKDDKDIEESWSLPGNISEALEYVKGWDPVCSAIIKKAPFVVDWKLVYRDPLPTWVSQSGRTVIIGDAAHPFLPTSVQGASQGVEDGVVLGTILHMTTKHDIPTATRAFEYIRYDRVRRAQKHGESTRNAMHKNPSERTEDDEVGIPFPEWLLNFDAEKHAKELYPTVAKILRDEGYTRPSERVIDCCRSI